MEKVNRSECVMGFRFFVRPSCSFLAQWNRDYSIIFPNALKLSPRFYNKNSTLADANIQTAQKKAFRSTIFMCPHVQILASKSPENATSFLLHFDDKSYLFNPVEGIQRILLEAGIKITRISAIFLTQSNWKSFGGLCG